MSTVTLTMTVSFPAGPASGCGVLLWQGDTNRFPDLELPRGPLDRGPEWGDPWRRSPTAERTTYDRIVRAVQACLVTPKRRVAGRLGGLDAWASLDGESPFWRLDPNQPAGSADLVRASASLAGHLAGGSLAEPGVLVAPPDDPLGGYLLSLPTPASRERFWGQNSGPRLLLDGGTLYARHLECVAVTTTALTDAGPEGVFVYSDDGASVPGARSVLGGVRLPDLSLSRPVLIGAGALAAASGSASAFDFPSGAVWLRRSPTDAYPYHGTWQKALSQQVNGDPSQWTLSLPQTFPGDSADLVYPSAGRSGVLARSAPYVRGDARYGSLRGFLTGPLLPAEEGLGGAPSAAFLALFPPLVSARRPGESHAARLARLQAAMTAKGTPLDWSLDAALGGASVTSVYAGSAGQGVYLPDLPFRFRSSSVFSVPASGFPGTVMASGLLVTDSPLTERLPSLEGALSAYSPFRFAGDPRGPRGLTPAPSDDSLVPGEGDAYAVLTPLQTLTVPTAHRAWGGPVLRGLLDPLCALRALTRTAAVSLLAPLDAADRGDPGLRSPGGLPLAAPGRSRASLWGDAPSAPAGAAPLDIDLDPPSPTPALRYGAGHYTPTRHDDPLAPRYS